MKLRDFILIFLIVVLIDLPVFAWVVPDTGQLNCYDDEKSISCPSEGSSFYGQDASYAVYPRSYTRLKLDNEGDVTEWIEGVDPVAEWIMTKDNVTGLIWEVKKNKDSVPDYDDPHDADNIYRWYDSGLTGDCAGNNLSGENTEEDFINILNDTNDPFGGYSDWRLPTTLELSTIIFLDTFNPAIDTGYFPNTALSQYWSATTFPSGSCFSAYTTDIVYGYEKTASKYSNQLPAIAVRSDQAPSDPIMVDNGDGTVTDQSVNLMWEQGSNNGAWQEALAYCEDLTLPAAGYSDWRLPEIHELRSMLDVTTSAPFVDHAAFPDTTGYVYWSSTTYPGGYNKVNGVYFASGETLISAKTNANMSFRCVRSLDLSYPLGDFNHSGDVDLSDAVIALKILAGIEPSDYYVDVEVNGDSRIGIEDLIYVLQVVADPSRNDPVISWDADNSGGGADDEGFETSYTEGDAPQAVGDADARVTDADNAAMANLTLTAAIISDGADEIFTIGGSAFPQNADKSDTVTLGGTDFDIVYTTATGVFTITRNGVGDMPVSDINTLLQGITYQNTSLSPTTGERTLSAQTNDGAADSNTAFAIINVIAAGP